MGGRIYESFVIRRGLIVTMICDLFITINFRSCIAGTPVSFNSHGSVLQTRESEWSPGQSSPPSDGEGLLQTLCRYWTPPPHFSLHFVQSWLHSLQDPLTAIRHILVSVPRDKIWQQFTSFHVFVHVRSFAESCPSCVFRYPVQSLLSSQVSKHTGNLLLCNL